MLFSRFSETILEEDFGIRDLRARSVTHGNEMSFQDFADLFKIFRYFNVNISHIVHFYKAKYKH